MYCSNYQSSMFLDKSDVIKTLVKLQTKSCELGVIPTNILKEIMDSLIDPITKIVNISMSKGQFASEWKTAILRPLQKKQVNIHQRIIIDQKAT